MFSNDSSGSANCQKGQCTIRLRYPVPGTILAGTGAGTGLQKNGRISGQPEPEPDIRYIPNLYRPNSVVRTYVVTFHVFC